MTIRFRLTLVYSAILALMLVVFGTALYSSQAHETLTSLKDDLTHSSGGLEEAVLRMGTFSVPPESVQQTEPPPRSFNEFSGDQTFQSLREREVVRVLNTEGDLIVSPFGREEDALPLSDDGLATVQSGQDWFESAVVNEENMLIYSHPITQNGEVVNILQVARSLTERDRTLNSLATTLLIASLVTVLVAFGVGWVFSGMALRPIDRITQTAQAIGEERDFTRRVDYTGLQDEVGQLANTFNQMLARLQAAYQRVENSLQQQRNFVADVSHELRTPLTTLRGNLGLLGRTPPAPPEEQADILNDMVDESDRLIRLVNQLLMLAYADAGRSLEKEAIEVQPLVNDTVRQVHQIDPNRKIEVSVPEDVAVKGDRDAFKQVMLILLDNALKYSEGDIHVHAEQDGAQVVLHVRDHGKGIPSAYLDKVFERFNRPDESSVVQGFGLGLPIAKALVEGMNGTISVESEEGRGSEFIIRLLAGEGS